MADDGILMPFGANNYKRDLRLDLGANQANPILISNQGRYIWLEQPYQIEVEKGLLRIEHKAGSIETGEGYTTLCKVFQYVANKYFPANGTNPDLTMFKAPQYNTWIEMMYEPNQEKVISYAHSVLKAGFPAGIIMIDVGWFEDYGNWTFHHGRFPQPQLMVEELHSLGFKVMLWICPFISPDSATFRTLAKKGYLIKAPNGEPVVREWWDGYSAVLDGTNLQAINWLHQQLNRLKSVYHIDGFKFDAGDPPFYSPQDFTNQPTTPHTQCESWGQVGLAYSFNEYRACWKLAGQPLVQRLRDKHHSWDENGLNTLIPNALAQGLMGYAFVCPDMIGGGEFNNFLEPDFKLDAELFVRYAQCSALFPMMQFSAAPWRLLPQPYLGYCLEAANLHLRMQDLIEELVFQAALSGEPIIRHLEYVFPNQGYQNISDQFMLGDRVMVAPVITKGSTSRQVVFPPGKWEAENGRIVNGPNVQEVEAPLKCLPWYYRC